MVDEVLEAPVLRAPFSNVLVVDVEEGKVIAIVVDELGMLTDHLWHLVSCVDEEVGNVEAGDNG